MNQQAAANFLVGTQQPIRGLAVPKLSREEVIPMAREELRHFMALIENLVPGDLTQPTDCTMWNVKDVVAHQASHMLMLTSFREFFNQFNPLNNLEYIRLGMNILDAANQRQVDKRSSWTMAQLIAEIRDNTEVSLIGRTKFPFLIRLMPIVTPGYEQKVSFGELIDNIFTRDMWMHRLDICQATGREMVQAADHDIRITALVMRDLDAHLSRKLGGRSVIYRLTGQAGGEWTVGGSGSGNTMIVLDTFDFHRLASGRMTYQQALEQNLVKIDGDEALGRLALQHTVVLY
jgi:uncharacterized protein (TIGR03083 family)